MNKQTELPWPDPAWDYASIWEELGKAQGLLTETLTLFQSERAEDANDEIDREALNRVRQIREHCNELERMLLDSESIQELITLTQDVALTRIAENTTSGVLLLREVKNSIERLNNEVACVSRSIDQLNL